MRRHLAPKPPPNPNFAQQPMSSILKAGLPQSQPRPPLKYATAAAAAVTPSASQQSNASASSSSAPTQIMPPAPAPAPAPAPVPPPPRPEPVVTTTLQDQITAVTSSPSLTQISTSSPFLSSTSASAQQPDGSFGSPLVSEAESHPEPPVSASAPSPLGAGESYSSDVLPSGPSTPPEHALTTRTYRRVRAATGGTRIGTLVSTCWAAGRSLIASTVCSATVRRWAGRQRMARPRTRYDVDRSNRHFGARDRAFARAAAAAATTATVGTGFIPITANCPDAGTTTSVSPGR